MRDTIDLARCVHCNTALYKEARRTGCCQNCGKHWHKMQGSSKRPTCPPETNVSRIEAIVERSPEEFRNEVYGAVVGWTLICPLAVVFVAWLVLSMHTGTILVFGSTALCLTAPLSYHLARRSWAFRAVGGLVIDAIDVALSILEIVSIF